MTVTRTESSRERLPAGIASRIDDYAELSRSRAEAGDARGAVLAAWAADVHVLQLLLREQSGSDAPGWAEQLATVGTAVARSVRSSGESLVPASGARGAAEAGRAALTEAVDVVTADLLVNRLTSLDHLDGLPFPSAGSGSAVPEGRTADGLALELRDTACDGLAVARELVRSGRLAEALHQVWLADLAAFEAHLLESARSVRDSEGITVALRWQLASQLLGHLPDELRRLEPSGVVDLQLTVAHFRALLARSVGPVEEAALQSCLRPLEAPSPA